MKEIFLNREKVDFVIIHLFIIENSEKIIRSYFLSIIDSGLYEECKIIVVNVRYTCKITLSKVLADFKHLEKIQFLSVLHHDDPYDSELEQYVYISHTKSINPINNRLGEFESILKLFYDNDLSQIIRRYESGIFLHSKSISHNTKYSTRASLNFEQIDKTKAFDKWVQNYESIMKEMKCESKFVYNSTPNFFSFKANWIDISLFEYLKSMYSYVINENYSEKLSPKFKLKAGENEIAVPYRRKGEFFMDREIEGTSRYSITNLTESNIYFANDRHAFDRFAIKMNCLRSNQKE